MGGYLPDGRAYHTATLLPNGQVIIVGGWGSDYDGTGAEIILYDPVKNRSNLIASMANLHTGFHTTTLLPNGSILITGGLRGSGSTLKEVDLYNLSLFKNNHWENSDSLTTGRFNHTTTLLPDTSVLVVGGFDSNLTALESTEKYNPITDQWQAAADMAMGRNEHTATLMANGDLLVTGGWNSGELANTERYDFSNDTWSNADELGTARRGHTATLLADGKVVVVGGKNGGYLTSVEIYDPVTDNWSPATANLSTARAGHTATLLHDGNVLIAGGWNGAQLATAELYDPVTDSWRSVGNLAIPRSSHTATLLPDGRVLVAGSLSNLSNADTAEIYDPTTESWHTIANFSTPRHSHSATLLPDGRVLIAGGNNPANENQLLTSTELYDPIADKWTTPDSLSIAQSKHTATLLADGTVLITGGLIASPFTPQAINQRYIRGGGEDKALSPQIDTISNPLPIGSSLEITGSQFLGFSESSGSSRANSATNYPIVQLRSLNNEQIAWLTLDGEFSANGYKSMAVNNFPVGPALVTIYTNAIPSHSAFIQIVDGMVWDNDSGDGLWSTASNWSGDTAPTILDTVVFNDTSTDNAVVDDFNSDNRVNSIFVDDGYTGEISMDQSVAAKTSLILRDGTFTVSDPGEQLLSVGQTVQHTGGIMQQTRAVGVGDATFLQIEDGQGSIRYLGAAVDTTTTNTDVGDVTVRVYGRFVNEYCTSTGNASPPYARRCFEITVSGTNGSADLTLYAPTNELNDIAEDSLAVYRYEEPLWAELTSSRGNSSGFSYASGQTPGFSYFLLAETGVGNEPTAVTLQAFSANTPIPTLTILLIALLLLGMFTFWLRRRVSR